MFWIVLSFSNVVSNSWINPGIFSFQRLSDARLFNTDSGVVVTQMIPDPSNPRLTPLNLGDLLKECLFTCPQIPFLRCSMLKFTLNKWKVSEHFLKFWWKMLQFR